jgi:hypothetical protein
MYAEIVFFDGAHFAHIVAHHESLRLKRIRSDALRQQADRGGHRHSQGWRPVVLNP